MDSNFFFTPNSNWNINLFCSYYGGKGSRGTYIKIKSKTSIIYIMGVFTLMLLQQYIIHDKIKIVVCRRGEAFKC